MLRIGLIGKRFGRWTVSAYAGNRHWACVCDCGTRAIVDGNSLRRGNTKSCGCWQLIDLTGKRFGRWVVAAYAGNKKWSFVCDCGARRVVRGKILRKGETKSCGCLSKELAKARATKHGMTGTPEYNSWTSMKQRCLNPCATGFKNYGGRGISICERWANSFEEFFADVETRPPGCSLDRKNNDGNYTPDNYRWADAKQQIQNRRPQRRRAAMKRRQVEPLPPPLDDPPF